MSKSAPPVEPDPRHQKASSGSRRSVVHSINGMVACTQPLAAEAGQRILRQGGNAADAAVAVAAALNVTEPASTGIGGDMFCLFYDAKTKKIHALNGSGRSTANLDLPALRKDLDIKAGQKGSVHYLSPHTVTVPGAAAGWVDTVQKFGSGKLSLEQILTPAIELGEKGFPVSEFSAQMWADSEDVLRNASPNFREVLKRDPKAEHFARAPKAGEVMRNPSLAKTFRTLATEGKAGFYTGRIAQAIADVVKTCGGHLSLDDLKHHMDIGPHDADPMSIKLTGHGIGKPPTSGDESSAVLELWEHPPNGQGIVALMAIGILQELEKSKAIDSFSASDHNSTKYLHAIIESLRIAFADASWWITDPHPEHNPNLQKPSDLISEPYLASRAKLFSPTRCSDPPPHGQPSPAQTPCDTVYFSITDKTGNAISFINSIYSSFGSGIIPSGCGFPLQNRGANFQVGPDDHPNVYAPRKRPYHTIIPAMVTKGDSDHNRQLHCVYGVMGGFMQPQGHVQVLMNMEVFGMDAQQALDAPRICIGAGRPEDGDVFDRTVYLEDGIPSETVQGLEKLGHKVKVMSRFHALFGRGQVITCRREEEMGCWVYSAGSDPRGDGCAVPS